MKIHVRLFARARDLAGTGHLELELPEGARVCDAKEMLLSQAPALAALKTAMLLAVAGEYASNDLVLSSDCELAVFPPVSGG